MQWGEQVKAALSGSSIFTPNKTIAASRPPCPALKVLTNTGKHGTAAADAARCAPPAHSRGFTCPRAPSRNNESSTLAAQDAAAQGHQPQLPFGPWRPERGAALHKLYVAIVKCQAIVIIVVTCHLAASIQVQHMHVDHAIQALGMHSTHDACSLCENAH